MKLENVVGLVGGILAFIGCLIPIASRGVTSLGVAEAGGLSTVLYLCACIGVLVSLLGLIGKMRKEEYVQIAVGLIGLVVAWMVHRSLDGAPTAFGLHLLYWGFAMLVAEGLFNFRDHRPQFRHAD